MWNYLECKIGRPWSVNGGKGKEASCERMVYVLRKYMDGDDILRLRRAGKAGGLLGWNPLRKRAWCL